MIFISGLVVLLGRGRFVALGYAYSFCYFSGWGNGSTLLSKRRILNKRFILKPQALVIRLWGVRGCWGYQVRNLQEHCGELCFFHFYLCFNSNITLVPHIPSKAPPAFPGSRTTPKLTQGTNFPLPPPGGNGGVFRPRVARIIVNNLKASFCRNPCVVSRDKLEIGSYLKRLVLFIFKI